MRRVGAIALSALLYAVATPPWSVDVLAPVVLVPVLLALRGRGPSAGFRLGVLFGIAAAAAVTWWAPGMLHRYFELPGPFAVAAAAGMWVLCVGLPFGAFAAGSARLLSAGRAAAYAGVPALWVAAEFGRTHLFTGVPWEFLGHALHRRLALVQVADVTGAWGLSFLCALSALAAADVLAPLGRGRRDALALSGLVACLWGGTALYGTWRLQQWAAAPDDPFPVALVQGNRAPARHVSPVSTALTLQAYLRLTRAALGGTRPALIVWPENTAGYFLDDDPGSLAVLQRLSAETGATLIVGGPRRERASGAAHNAAYEVGQDGIAGTYDKVRLVPFAEYPPLGLHGLAGPAAVLSPGRAPVPVPHPRGPLGILICYELLYPHLARALVADGARLLVNIANDTWMDPVGNAGAAQIASMAVFRAVETRRWLVRATTTGVSAVIAPTGEVAGRVAVGKAEVLLKRVGLISTMSPYVRIGDAFAWSCVLAALAALASARPAGRPA